jgi:hypothetical protein
MATVFSFCLEGVQVYPGLSGPAMPRKKAKYLRSTETTLGYEFFESPWEETKTTTTVWMKGLEEDRSFPPNKKAALKYNPQHQRVWTLTSV